MSELSEQQVLEKERELLIEQIESLRKDVEREQEKVKILQEREKFLNGELEYQKNLRKEMEGYRDIWRGRALAYERKLQGVANALNTEMLGITKEIKERS